VALTRRLLRDTTYPPDAALRTAMVQMLSAVGSAAKDSAPEVLAQIRVGESRAKEPEYALLRDESVKAYKAITGQDPPKQEKKP
jgi:hypothetical protein